MRHLIQKLGRSQTGAYVSSFVFLLLLGAAMLSTIGCNCGGQSTYKPSALFSAALPAAVSRATADGSTVHVWIEIAENGVFTPTTTAQGTSLKTSGGQNITFLDTLAEKGYFAVRVPHAPPTCTASVLGLNPYAEHMVEFKYYSPPSTNTATTIPVTVTRNMTLEAQVSSQLPPGNCSHWEVWWLPPGEKFPIPDQPFRLEDNFLFLAVQLDFVDADAYACAGCPVGFAGSNGYITLGPFEAPLRFSNEDAPRDPLASFGPHCGYILPELKQSIGRYITPTVPFTEVYCLENWDTVARTFTITTRSAQGWAYQYYYRTAQAGSTPAPASGTPFTVTVAQPSSFFPGMMAILAVHTPTIAVTDTLREMLFITATSTVSPQVQAHTFSFALAPGYTLQEPRQPLADFIAAPRQGVAPLTVMFTDTSAYSPTAWLWQFGDNATSAAQHPTHTYNNPGDYTVTLTVSNTHGSNTLTRTNYIAVAAPGCITVTGVTINGPTAGVTGAAYDFAATVNPANAAEPIAYTWTPTPTLGQGQATVTYTWTTTGVKDIRLDISNCAGTGSAYDTHNISIQAPTPGVTPVQSVTIVGPLSGTVNLGYTFQAVVSPADASQPIIYTWTPTPTTGQSEATATYTWTTPGAKTITVIAQNAGGSDSDTHTIQVNAPPSSWRKVYLPVVIKNG